MIYFNCDYMSGGHPEVLRVLTETNLEKSVGYGFDSFTSEARNVILKCCGLAEGEVFSACV